MNLALSNLKYCGARTLELLNKLQIRSLTDLLFYFPKSYEDRSNILPISLALRKQHVFLCVNILEYNTYSSYSKSKITKATIKDQSGSCDAIWFNQAHIPKAFPTGSKVFISGKVSLNTKKNTYQVIVSHCEFWKEGSSHIQSQYPLTQGLYNSQLKRLIQQALKIKLNQLDDFLPDYIIKRFNFISLKEAISYIHNPQSITQVNKAKERLIFDELLLFTLPRFMHQNNDYNQGEACNNQFSYVDKYLNTIPYSLTLDQQKAFEDISSDMSSSLAMNRLLQGDVGCGKTDVAILAALIALQANKKVIFLVPTQVLADQHYMKLTSRLDHLNINIKQLKGSMKTCEKNTVKEILSSDELVFAIGTHALLQESVEIKNLGLLIIDEQHRFGVIQRLKMIQESHIKPHCLFLSATPIPRTLMLLDYDHLKHSIIHTMPKGRQEIKTYCLAKQQIPRVYQHCLEQIRKKNQVYFVFPLVSPSEKIDLSSATEAFESLTKSYFKDVRVGLLHGKLTAEEKESIMNDFHEHRLDLLISTTVIEVGLDVPNATTIVIFDAFRFGLAQLHQLRGRVGRGSKKSYCFLIFDQEKGASKRLKLLEKCHNGFKLAEYDLALRGPGDVIGTQQSGPLKLKLACLSQHKPSLKLAMNCAKEILKKDPKLTNTEHQKLNNLLLNKINFFGENLN